MSISPSVIELQRRYEEKLLGRAESAEKRIQELSEKIGKYFQSIGGFGVEAGNEVETLLAYAESWRNEAMKAKWILCSERMPESNAASKMVYVLAYVSGWSRPRLLGYYTGAEPRWYNEEDNQLHDEVIAWMCLPKLPEGV